MSNVHFVLRVFYIFNYPMKILKKTPIVMYNELSFSI